MVRDGFLASAAALSRVVDADAVVAAWDAPSALEAMTVGALTAHAARAVGTVRTYLEDDGAADRTEVIPVSPAGYIVAVLGDAGPDDEVNVGVRTRAASSAAEGPSAVAERLREDLAVVRNLLASTSPEHRVTVRDGIVLTLDDYLATRVVELVVHLDDLACSVKIDLEIDDESARVAVATLADVARLRHGWRAMVRHLARTERASGPVAAL